MSRPNKHRRKKTPRGSKAASRKSAAPGRKKKTKSSAASAKPTKTTNLAKSFLLNFAKQLAQQQARTSGAGKRIAVRGEIPPPPDPQPVAATGAPPALQQVIAELRGENPSTPATSVIPRRAPNGGDYHSRYFLEIYGGMKPDGSHLLIIDRKTRIKIDWLQFILLLILASHSRSKAGLDSPINIRGGDYLQPSRVEDIIKQLKAGTLLCAGRRLPECQNAYDAALIRNAKWDLRLRVQRKSKNSNFLDRGDGAGYRISAPASRIKITLQIEGEHDLVFDWQE